MRLERPLAQAGFLIGDVRVLDQGAWGRLDAALEGTALSGKLQVHLNKKGDISIVPQGNAAYSIRKALESEPITLAPTASPPLTASNARSLVAREISSARSQSAQPTRSTARGMPGELVVDCSKYGKSLIGPTEWRGVVHSASHGWREVFHSPLYERGHNNLGEFLAIIDACTRIERREIECASLWSDSKTALSWFRTGIIKTTLDVEAVCDPLFVEAVRQAQQWLEQSDRRAWMKLFSRWDVTVRGENPADFGRK